MTTEMTARDDVVKALREHLNPKPRTKTAGGYTFLDVLPRLTCGDGFTLSVQASRTHYCAPREDHGGWYQVEVGFPSEPVPRLNEWAEEPDDHTRTVFGYVPIEAVIDTIMDHGGLALSPRKGGDNG